MHSAGSRSLHTEVASPPVLDYLSMPRDAKELDRAILQNWHILDQPPANLSGRKFYRSK